MCLPYWKVCAEHQLTTPALSQKSVTLHDIKDTFVVVGHPRKKLWRRISVVGAADKQDPFGLVLPRFPILEIKWTSCKCSVKVPFETPYLAALFLAFRTIYSDRHEISTVSFRRTNCLQL